MNVLRRHPLASFFVPAYAVTWLLGHPRFSPGAGLLRDPAHPVADCPTRRGDRCHRHGGVHDGRDPGPGRACRRLWQQLTCWDVGIAWFVVALLLFPLAELLITAVVAGPQALRALTPAALAVYPVAFASHFIFGPLFEETGWRGSPCPGCSTGSVPFGHAAAGIAVGGWHFFLYPPAWLQNGGLAGVVGMAMFVAFTVAVSVIFTWVSNNTRASLLLVMLLHGSINGTATYVQMLADRGVIPGDAAAFSAGFGALLTAAAAALLIAWLTHRRLGYPRYRYEAEDLDLGQPTSPVASLTR